MRTGVKLVLAFIYFWEKEKNCDLKVEQLKEGINTVKIKFQS